MDEYKGCGIHINHNGSDLRCGHKEFSPISGHSTVIICNHCQRARQLQSYQDAFHRLTSKGPLNE